MGHVMTRYYMTMFDDASLHFLRELGFDFSHLATKQIGWADVRHVIEYHRELQHGTPITITSILTRIGNSSLDYKHELRNSQTAQLHATMVARTVQFDLQTRKAIPLFEHIRDQAQHWLQTEQPPTTSRP